MRIARVSHAPYANTISVVSGAPENTTGVAALATVAGGGCFTEMNCTASSINSATADGNVSAGTCTELGYGILAWSYWRGLRYRLRMRPLAWLLAVTYAVTDELHQSFVPGRHPSPVDVLLFDGLGAMLALTLLPRWVRAREDEGHPGS